MHWVLQENLFNEAEWDTLTGALTRLSLPFSVHKVVPFSGDLVPEPTPLHSKVVCFGSYSMRHVALKNRWVPGVYDLLEQDFTQQLLHWGEHMLNSDSRVVAFKSAVLTQPSFVRPIVDSKNFTGKVFEADEFNDWRHSIVDLGHDYGNALNGDTLVQICRPKVIHAEYRYWVVDGKIVTRSLYKRGGQSIRSSAVDGAIDDFVKQRVDPSELRSWRPHRAFVIDVCQTELGLKIVEINTINAAGFYAGDVQKLVMALEELEAD